jgi:S-adenosylmethionine decarboxylase
MYRYLEEVTEVAKMTPLTGPAVFSIPFANELSNYTNEIERELEKLGTELKTVNKMRKRINARKFQDSGCTGTMVWSESHCASHSWPEKDFITIDLYSCKDFNVEEVINFTRKYWYSGRLVYRLIHRYTDYNIVEDDVILYGME